MNESENSSENKPVSEAEGSGINVRVFGRTDVGLVRDHNEDNFLVADLTQGNRSIMPEVRTHTVGPKGSIFAVCDGMGGAAAGEVASQIGVDTIYEMMQEAEPLASDDALAKRLDEAICEAGTRIFTAAKLNRGQRGMGTTTTAAVLNGPRLIVGQVGDSRAHIIRGGRLVQVSKDQSLVQQLIDAKQLTEEEAKNFDRSNIILQALGTTEEVHVDMTSVILKKRDALVMCSDGLSGLVEPHEILEIVDSSDDPMEACRRLTEMACERGGDDNITVIVARFDGPALEEPADEELGYEKFEFSKVTETTVKAPLSRFSKQDDEEGSEAEGEAKEAADEKTEEPKSDGESEQASSEPKPDEAPKKDAEPAEPDEVQHREEKAEGGGKGKTGVIIALLLGIGGLGAAGIYVATSGTEVASPVDAVQPSAIPDTEEEAPATAPDKEVEPIESPAKPSEADAQPTEEPRLAPVAEEEIISDGEDEGREAQKDEAEGVASDEEDDGEREDEEEAAEGKKASKIEAPVKKQGSAGQVQTSEPVGTKKKPKKAKKKVIDDNPY